MMGITAKELVGPAKEVVGQGTRVIGVTVAVVAQCGSFEQREVTSVSDGSCHPL